LLVTGCGGGGTAGADAAGCEPEGTHEGEATYYDADGSGNCSYDAQTSPPLLVAAMNTPDWDGSAVCGGCAAVTGPSGSVTVRIVDRCPECATGDLDLSPDAFDRIAERRLGRVAITWRFVSCEANGPVSYRFKEGSNPYWTAIQVRNARHRIAKLEGRAAGGIYRELLRESYNFFIGSPGLGEGPYDLRITDVYGAVLEDLAVPFAEASTVEGAANFLACAR
jgi:expansin (peptidoglycan-binding protein)